jgi:hypothetical protein
MQASAAPPDSSGWLLFLRDSKGDDLAGKDLVTGIG